MKIHDVRYAVKGTNSAKNDFEKFDFATENIGIVDWSDEGIRECPSEISTTLLQLKVGGRFPAKCGNESY